MVAVFTGPVALIGASRSAREVFMAAIVRGILDVPSLVQKVASKSDGAVVTFAGVVRDNNRGKKVVFMEYEAYDPMAVKMMERIETEIRDTWGLHNAAIHHRVGRLNVGESSVLIVVGAPHRDEAFAACKYAIDRLKKFVPIWKKEVYEDGEYWIESGTVKEARA